MSLSADEKKLKRLLKEAIALMNALQENDTLLSETQLKDLLACLEQITTVAYKLDFGLLSTSAILVSQTTDLLVDDKKLNSGAAENMLAWLKQSQKYIQNINNTRNIEALIETVQLEHQNELRAVFLPNSTLIEENLEKKDSLNNDTLDPWGDDIDIDDILGAEESFDDSGSLLETLSKELNLKQTQFDLLVEQLEKKSPKNNTQETITDIVEHFEKLETISHDVDLFGLAILAGFFKTNFTGIGRLSLRRKKITATLLAMFPTVFTAYLKNPTEDNWCLEILNIVTHEAWKKPVSYREENKLIKALLDQLEVSGEQPKITAPAYITNEDMSLVISSDTSPGLLDSFFVETPKDAEELSSEIAAIGNGENLHEHLRRAQRFSHTIKGSANLIGVKAIANIAHNLETIFEYLLLDDSKPSEHLAETMQESADTIELMIEMLQQGSTDSSFAKAIMQSLLEDANSLSGHQQTTSFTEQLEKTNSTKEQLSFNSESESTLALHAQEETQHASVVNNSTDIAIETTNTKTNKSKDLISQEQAYQQHSGHPVYVRKKSKHATPFDQAQQALQKVLDDNQNSSQKITNNEENQDSKQAQDVMRVPRALIDNALNLVGEASIAYGQIMESLKNISENTLELKQHERIQQARRYDLENLVNVQGAGKAQNHLRVVNSTVQQSTNTFDSLEMDEFTEMHRATHSYIESVADSSLIAQKMSESSMTVESLIIQQQRLNSALQETMMRMRLVPASNLNARLQRTVRQATRMTNKKAELTIVGGNLMIDSDVLNSLADPLMHLLRNAVDHGIESATERGKKGKNEAGQITIIFEQMGNDIIIRCQDDGHGLDHDKILNKALSAGVTDKQKMNKDAIARLILLPGFSTRSNATQVSGRGVGMDVVNTMVTQLRGNVNIHSEFGQGTEINLEIPITLFTSHSLLVKSNEQIFAVPTNSLMQILAPDDGILERVGNLVSYRNERDSYAAKSLEVLLGLSTSSHFDNETSMTRKPMLLARVGNEITAIMVDEVISTVDLVIKACGYYVRDINGIVGVSILGNGNVVPVVDIAELVRGDNSGISRVQRSSLSVTQEIPSVLIVDDSISVRSSLAEIVSDAGFNTLQAHDGIEAIKILSQQTPDIILTDLEMPRMNGIDMTSNIRAQTGLSNLPIIMITSRTTQKHKDQAIAAGVSHYLTKPVIPEDLVDLINQQFTESH